MSRHYSNGLVIDFRTLHDWVPQGEHMNFKSDAARALILAAAIALCGCATAYQSKSLTGGFSETDLGPTSFKISFVGNGFTSAERSSDFAMLRAADRSIEDGCNFFGVVNDFEGGSTSSMTVANVGYGKHGAWGSAFTSPIFKPNSVLLIKCFAVQPPGADLYDAHYVMHSIRAKYKIADGTAQSAQSVATAAQGQAAPISTQGVALAPAVAPPANVAQLVLAAQRVSTGQGCGDVSASPDGSFEASCPAGTIVIECDGATCRPVRMKSS